MVMVMAMLAAEPFFVVSLLLRSSSRAVKDYDEETTNSEPFIVTN